MRRSLFCDSFLRHGYGATAGANSRQSNIDQQRCEIFLFFITSFHICVLKKKINKRQGHVPCPYLPGPDGPASRSVNFTEGASPSILGMLLLPIFHCVNPLCQSFGLQPTQLAFRRSLCSQPQQRCCLPPRWAGLSSVPRCSPQPSTQSATKLFGLGLKSLDLQVSITNLLDPPNEILAIPAESQSPAVEVQAGSHRHSCAHVSYQPCLQPTPDLISSRSDLAARSSTFPAA